MTSEARKRLERRRAAEVNASIRAKRDAGVGQVRSQIGIEEAWLRQLSAIPPDTRSLTGRLMGDPLPGDTRRSR